MAALIDLEQARRIALAEAGAQPAESEPVELHGALGRVLAEDIRAEHEVPAFRSSAMDGYALRARDTAGATDAAPVRLEVVGESRAGHPVT
ncbi:MAG: hypothetical protein ACYDA6_02480, partial [Solirubrobacteraceae bacterium]